MEQQSPRSGLRNERTWLGIFFLLIGGAWILRLAGFPVPGWLFSWPVILILVGLYLGVKQGFRDFSWLILIIIGGIFLTDHIWIDVSFRKYLWPLVLVVLGLVFIFAPKGPCRKRRKPRAHYPGYSGADEEMNDTDNTLETNLDIVSVFGGVKKKVLSKQFTGGEIVCVFGGAQINLSNADFNSPIVLDIVHIFGGAKLVVPANWDVRSEIAAVFGGVDDKRPQPTIAVPEKTLILKGTVIFGGVEINSF